MFSDEDKKVFQYHDGARTVWGDPVTIYRRLSQLLDGDPNQCIARSADANGGVAFDASERLLQAVRVAFDMPFDRATGAGATEEDCDRALDALIDFLEKKNPSGSPTPTSTRRSVVAELSTTTGPSSASG